MNLSLPPTCRPTPSPAESCTAAWCWFCAAPAKLPCPPLVHGQNVSQSLEPPAANCTSKKGHRGALRIQIPAVWLNMWKICSTCTAILILPFPQCRGSAASYSKPASLSSPGGRQAERQSGKQTGLKNRQDKILQFALPSKELQSK